MDSSGTSDQDPDIEMHSVRNINPKVVTEATVDEWIGIINEFRRNSLLPEPRSLAELGYDAIPVSKPLAGMRIRLFELSAVIPGSQLLAALGYDAIPVPEPSPGRLSNLFDQSAVCLETDPLAVPNSMCNYFNSNLSEESVVDPTPSGSLSGNQIHCVIDLEQTVTIPTADLPAEQNFKAKIDRE